MKRIMTFLLAIIIIASTGIVSASAAKLDAAPQWYVTYGKNGSLGGNIGGQFQGVDQKFSVNDQILDLEPGDERTFYVRITNHNPTPTRWYMKNIVDRSLEETGYSLTSGGAYSYTLTYTRLDPKDTTYTTTTGDVFTIFDSDTVGENGDLKELKNRTGLHEATKNLESYIFLDTLNQDESGVVALTVKYEGETQGNVYQNTISDIALTFAVEETGGGTRRSAVKTGDENNLIPYYIGMIVAGLLFLYFALDAYTDKLYMKKRSK